MKIVIPYRSVRRALRSMQLLLIAAAVLGLGYCGFVMVDSWRFQQVERHNLERLLMERRNPLAKIPAELPRPVADEGMIGRIEVRRLGLSTIVGEGTSTTILRRAAGHIPGTGFPGR